MTINHIGCSGGKDSTALLLWAVHESGYPIESIRATFSDTKNEAEETLDQILLLSERVHPIEWIHPNRGYFELAAHKGRFPSNSVRFCTPELKLEPCKKYVYGLIEEGHEVLLHSGVRADESAERALLEEFGTEGYTHLPIRRPLLKWTIEDIWAIHERYGIPRHPFYAMGIRRVGCAPCFMCRKHEIKVIATNFPDRIARIREAETGDSTFFPIDKVPKFWRSKTVTTKDGRKVKVPTIDDAVAWSKTTRGGKQEGLEFEDDLATCSHLSGACE